MAVQRMHLARNLSGSRYNRKTLLACVTAVLLLAAGAVAIQELGPSDTKLPANRILSPSDTSLAPPQFISSAEVKVKRTARVTISPAEKKRGSPRHWTRSRHQRRHVERSDPAVANKDAVPRQVEAQPPAKAGSAAGPAEPPMPSDP